MNSFIDMVESGCNAENEFDDAGVHRALVALFRRAEEQGKLTAQGVWRLHRSEVVELQRDGQLRPPGGWRALSALCVGAGVLKARDDGFVTGDTDPETWEDTAGARRRLVEAFTRWLIPPSTAASLFLAMDVHPLWGLRLARRLHVDAPMLDSNIDGWRDEQLLPDEDLAELRKGIFAALSTVVSALARLDAAHRYGFEALVNFVGDAIRFGRAQIETTGDGLDVLIDDIGNPEKAVARSIEFAAHELADGVFVPAGVMRRYDDDTFAVDPAPLQNVKVGGLGEDAQRTWLQCFLIQETDDLVA